jgi:very-short-patch-repair endonuclease
VRGAGLPEPSANVLIEDELVDCVWPQARLVVEVDSYRFHKSRRQFEKDRRRDAKLLVAGYQVLRVTQRRVEFEVQELVGELVTLLSAERGAGAAASGP